MITVTHEDQNNTLEVTWLEQTNTEIKRIKCVTYSLDQADLLRADLGADAEKYIFIAGW